MADAENFSHEDEGIDQGSNFMSIDLQDCKQLQQPVPIEATHCRKGVFIIMKDCPCKVADLKISKTGKHGHAKANMVGYDVITGKKYQETVPGHITMFQFTPIKIEYEVADIVGSDITCMDPDGNEYHFNVPDNEAVGAKLLTEFKENQAKNGDNFFVITVLYAPRLVGKKWMANMYVESYKLGKE